MVAQRILGGLKWMAAAGVVFAAAACPAIDEFPRFGGFNQPHHITYYHPGYFEANGTYAAYGAPFQAYPGYHTGFRQPVRGYFPADPYAFPMPVSATAHTYYPYAYPYSGWGGGW